MEPDLRTRQYIHSFERELTYCTYCPRLCRFACPVAEGERRETVTPTAKMTLLQLVDRRALELDREAAEPWFHCTGCGLHAMPCEHRIEIFPAMQGGRKLAAEHGWAPEPLQAMAQAVEGAEAELQALAARALPEAPRRGEAALVPGEHALRHDPALVRHAWQVLCRVLPQPPALWSGPQELGLVLLAAGMGDALRSRAERVAAAAAGFRRLWVLDPEEAWLLQVHYPELGQRIAAEVRLPLEALDRSLPDAWRGRAAGGPSFTYHDPCFRGRRLGVFDAPRRVLKLLTGSAPLEPTWSRDWGWCCGGGQRYPELEPAGARAIAARRAEQLLAPGSRRVVTTCPRCRTQLRTALAGCGVEVCDLLELVDLEWG